MSDDRHFQVKEVEGKQVVTIDVETFHKTLHEGIEEAVSKSLKEHHPCLFKDDDVNILADVATGAKMVKKSIMFCIAGGIMYILYKGITLVYSGSIPRPKG